MKSVYRFLALLGFLCPVVVVAADLKEGFIIYKDHSFSSDSSASLARFTSIQTFPTVSKLVLTNGKRMEVLSGQIGAIIPLPQDGVSEATVLQTLTRTEQRFPQFKTTLNEVRQLWQKVAETKKSTAASSGAKGTPTGAGRTIQTLDGQTFTQVEVTAKDAEFLSISHSSGSARLAFSNLPEAIRKEFDYDPAKAEIAMTKRLEEEKKARSRVVVRVRVLQRVEGSSILATLLDGSEQTIMVMHVPSHLVDGDLWEAQLYSAGITQYTTILGVGKTVRAFSTQYGDEAKPKLIGKIPNSPRRKRAKADTGSAISTGTGFAISANGHILTNAHVIDDADVIHVLIEGKPVEAKVIASDENNDLAVLKIEAATKPLRLSSERPPRLGEDVFVAGFPLPNIQGSNIKVTKGIVSGLGGIHDDPRHVQIDAAVQPGNSGGPLLDKDGNVLGVVNARLNDSAVMAATGTVPQNVNYAIKASYVNAFLATIPNFKPATNSSAGVMDVGSLIDAVPSSTFQIRCESTQ